MLSLSIGSTLQNGKYEIVKVLGQGGFGITYLAVHTLLDKKVAIKEFFPKDFCDRHSDTKHITLGTTSSAELVSRLRGKFVKEAKNIAKLSHPNIIPIQDIFEENNTAYYLMDFIEGESLGDILKSNGALSEERAIYYIRQISLAIDYMHSKNMNHLDIKPGNIMIRKSDDMPILIDFGTSKQYDEDGGQTSTMVPGFTHGYAPIEQYKPGGVSTFTPQTDIYALGATLYALLTGKKPPHYSEILEDGLPTLPVHLRQSTKDGLEHAMEVRKNKRPASISEFLQHFNLLEETLSDNSSTENMSSKASSLENSIEIQEQKNSVQDNNTVYAEIVEAPEVKHGNDRQSSNGNSIFIDGIEFVDLGLSVLWANQNIGSSRANDIGSFVNKLDSVSTGLVKKLFIKGAKIPTINNFEELRNQCNWEQIELNGVRGYLVKGRTGNSIFLPFSGNGNPFGSFTHGRLFTRESFYKDVLTRCYYFYYNHQGVYKNTQYSCDYDCPVRMVFPK